MERLSSDITGYCYWWDCYWRWGSCFSKTLIQNVPALEVNSSILFFSRQSSSRIFFFLQTLTNWKKLRSTRTEIFENWVQFNCRPSNKTGAFASIYKQIPVMFFKFVISRVPDVLKYQACILSTMFTSGRFHRCSKKASKILLRHLTRYQLVLYKPNLHFSRDFLH